MNDFPPLIRLHAMCRQRAGHLEWPLVRLSAILEDFPDLEWRMVAGRCLDYIAERPGVADGPRTLRTFMEREQRQMRPRPDDLPQKPSNTFACMYCGEPADTRTEIRKRRKLGIHGSFSGHLECQQKEDDLHGNDSGQGAQQREGPDAGIGDQERSDSEGGTH